MNAEIRPPIPLKAGQVHYVSWAVNPTAGYWWRIMNLPDCVSLINISYTPDRPVVGSPGIQTFTFLGIKPGTGHIDFCLMPPGKPLECEQFPPIGAPEVTFEVTD